jgi:hypothetical protein
MPDQSTKQEAARKPDAGQSSALRPTAVSRRRKVAIVLVLMVCGYFLIDEREPPPALSTVTEVVSDPAIVELMQDDFLIPQTAPVAADNISTTDRAPLQIPQDDFAVHEVAHVDHHSTVDPAFPEPRIAAIDQPVQQPKPPRRRQQAPRPRLRFTGEIQPLY